MRLLIEFKITKTIFWDILVLSIALIYFAKLSCIYSYQTLLLVAHIYSIL